MNIRISIPLQIHCKCKGKNKQDSFFYAGNNIATVKILNREYVLTTAGMYDFGLINGRKRDDLIDQFKIDSDGSVRSLRQFRDIARNYRLTDQRIKKLTDDGALVSNWGWFGINVWDNGKAVSSIATDLIRASSFSGYDEAMEAFIAFIQKDLANK